MKIFSFGNKTNLKEDYCTYNNISELVINEGELIDYIFCSGNNLTSFDVTGMPNLAELHISGNQLESLDCSNNPLLWFLDVSYNNLRELKVDGCRFEELRCNDNQLEQLDLSNAMSSYYEIYIEISDNPMESSQSVMVNFANSLPCRPLDFKETTYISTKSNKS